MATLKEKYSRYPRTIFKTVGEAPKETKSRARCSLCNQETTDRVNKGAEFICSLCTMGMADAYDPKEMLNFLELLEAIKEGKLKKYRQGYGFSQVHLARQMGISTRHYRRMEEKAYIPVSKVIEKIRMKIENVRSGH